MIKLKLNIIIFILLAFNSLYSSEEEKKTNIIDSLELQLQNATSADTNKVNTLVNLSFYYHLKNPEKGLEYANYALELSQNLNYKFGLGKSYNVIGVNYFAKNQFEKSVIYYSKANDIFNKLGDKLYCAKTFVNISLVNVEMFEFNNALTNLFKAEKIALQYNFREFISNIYSNIGIVYSNMKDENKALEFYLKAHKLMLTGNNPFELSRNLSNISISYTNLKQYKEAIDALDKAIVLRDKEKTPIAYNTILIGYVYTYYEMFSDDNFIVNCKNFNKTKIKYLLFNSLIEAEEIAVKNQSIDQLIPIYEIYQKFYRDLKDWQKAYNYLSKQFLLTDSINSDAQQKRIEEYSHQWETTQSKIQISELEKQKHQMELKNNILIFVIIFLVTIILLGILFVKFYIARFKQKRNY